MDLIGAGGVDPCDVDVRCAQVGDKGRLVQGRGALAEHHVVGLAVVTVHGVVVVGLGAVGAGVR